MSRCAGRLSEMVLRKELQVCDITEDLVSSNLQSNPLLPDPSLVVRLGIFQRSVVGNLFLYNLYSTVLYCTVLYCTVLFCTVLHCNVLDLLYCFLLHCYYSAVWYCTHLYTMLLFNFKLLLYLQLFINLPWGHVRSNKKCWPNWFSGVYHYFCYKQTDKQSIFIDVSKMLRSYLDLLYFSNAEFLPWQIRLSEIHSIESCIGLSIHQFTGR